MMSLTHMKKRLEQLEEQFIWKERGTILSVQQAMKREGALRVAIQSISTWMYQIQKQEAKEHELYQKAKEVKEQLKEKMLQTSAIILRSINEEYHTSYTLEEILEDQEWYYHVHGLLKTIEKSGKIDRLFQKLLTDVIPPHPQMEYPLARKMTRTFYLHVGPTNSGKTHQAIEALKKSRKGIYLSPLRLLALEIYERLNEDGVPCHLVTGEEELRSLGAHHISCTIEKASFDQSYDVAVIDEAQMIGDPQRGSAWTRAILGILAVEVHVCCSLNALPLLKKLITDCGDPLIVEYHERQTPLLFQDEPFHYPNDVRAGDALIVFSRKKALQVAADLGQQNRKASVIYGNLPPETRRKQVRLFLQKETDVVVSTDAIGMGMNLPIQRVVFLEAEKFDGNGIRELTPQEVKQISGRAGRKGIYEEGYVNSLKAKKRMEKKLHMNDTPLQTAYIAPQEETILCLPFGSLQERLMAWVRYEIPVPYFKKADISELLELLQIARKYEAILPIDVMYKAVTIPFDYTEKELLSQWFLYLDCWKLNKDRLPKPKRRRQDLSGLEVYYRAIGLYYSFSRTFGLSYDVNWVRREREKTAEDIHQLLQIQRSTVKVK
ncbi:ATP-dependent RNA helicase SUPV3L1/SUV3 [Ammoniphilus resinae]|uniref:RNA helicase n=2 Tax=Ammoniphilus resinae TaxID=861532 RepID=A0ABS4GIT1_9BACL|nr:ATP-dependent RNA helicase SUPV3L1/SUV3 [Ammoniphilus resinae]